MWETSSVKRGKIDVICLVHWSWPYLYFPIDTLIHLYTYLHTHHWYQAWMDVKPIFQLQCQGREEFHCRTSRMYENWQAWCVQYFHCYFKMYLMYMVLSEKRLIATSHLNITLGFIHLKIRHIKNCNAVNERKLCIKWRSDENEITEFDFAFRFRNLHSFLTIKSWIIK